MSYGSTPSDAANAIYDLYSLGYKCYKSRKSKKKRRKARRLREAAERARIDRAMGSYNTSHSPLASKRSFFVPKLSHNPLRSFYG